MIKKKESRIPGKKEEYVKQKYGVNAIDFPSLDFLKLHLYYGA